MANSATRAPARKVAKRNPTASPAAALSTSKTVQAPAPIENEARTPANFGAAFASVSSSLQLAYMTDEPHAYSGDSDRLLRIAAVLANDASHSPPPDDNGAECIAFDIAALVIASRRVPGDTVSEARRNHIEQAKKALTWLAEAADVLQENARPNTKSAFNGHTPEQVEFVIGDIATHANTLRHFVRNAGELGEETILELVAMGLQIIGASADQLNPINAVGSPCEWLVGDIFYEAGKAVQA